MCGSLFGPVVLRALRDIPAAWSLLSGPAPRNWISPNASAQPGASLPAGGRAERPPPPWRSLVRFKPTPAGPFCTMEPAARPAGFAYRARQLSGKEMALEAIISSLGEALGEAAEGPGLPPAAISLCLRTAMGRSPLAHLPWGAGRSTSLVHEEWTESCDPGQRWVSADTTFLTPAAAGTGTVLRGNRGSETLSNLPGLHQLTV